MSAAPAPEPERTAAEDRDVRRLLLDLATTNLCDHIAGEFVGLSGEDGKAATPEESKKDPARARQGRLLVERCKTERVDGEELSVELAGRGWRWVDRSSKKLGAKFSVSQYVRFDAKVKARGTVDISYARSKRIARLLLSATAPVKAEVRPRGEVDADSQGAWATLLGGASTLVGEGPDEQAQQKVSSEGSSGLARKLSAGYTVVFDLCSGQKYEAVGALPEGELPQAPLPAAGRVWKENERVELMAGGIDLAGPFSRDDLPMSFEIHAEAGDGVVSTLICAPDAQRIASAFLDAKPIPEVESLAGEVATAGVTKTLRVESASCDVVLFSRASGKLAKFAYLAWPDQKRARPFAPCDPP